MSEGFVIGPWLMRWHGFLVVLGIIAGALLIVFEAKRRSYGLEVVYYLFLPLLIWGTVGARLWHIFTPPLSSVQLGLTREHYLTHGLDALSFWIGGFGIPGAIMGGSLGLFIFSYKYEQSFWELADLLAPGLALAQAIGRMGNFFNQELYGLPSNLPWAIFIQPASRLIGYELVEFYHPLFAYEMVLNFVNMVFLLGLAQVFMGRLKPGFVFLTYLTFYSIFRFLLEFLRLDVALVHGININQVFFALLFICAGIGLFVQNWSVQKL